MMFSSNTARVSTVRVSTVRISAALLLATLGLAAGPASAQTPAFTVDDLTGQSLGNPPFTLGFEFTANSALTVSALGLFDDSQDGLDVSHPIGLYDSGGTLLASATVAAGTVDPLVNQFRYVSIAPLTLTAGQDYFLAALYPDANDPLIFSGSATNFVSDPSITFVQSSYESSGSLTFPTGNGGPDPGYFGPNFLEAAVPEASTTVSLGLLLALGMSGGMVAARRKRA